MAGILQVPLFADETLPSWVARLARANGKLSSFSFCGDVGIDFFGLMLGRPAEIEKLAFVTGRASPELTRHALVVGAGHRVQLAQEIIPKKFMRKSRIAFCPSCFAADDVGNQGPLDTRRYFRKSWLMDDAKICTLHGCRIDALPPHRPLQDFCQVLDRHSDLVANFFGAPTRAEPSLVDTFIVERLAGQFSHGALLNQSSLVGAIYAARHLGVALTHGAELDAGELSSEDIALATTTGMTMLRSGAAAVHDALDNIVNPRATNIRSAYGKLARSLIYSRNGDFQAIKEVVMEHVSGRFMLRSQTIDTQKKKWTSANELARVTGSTTDRMRYRLYQTGITNTLNFEIVPMSAALELLNDDPRDIVKTKTACTIIGCDEDMFDNLVETGLVKHAYDAVRKSSGNRNPKVCFRRPELVAFRRSVEDRALSERTSEMITLRVAARRTGNSKATIIAGILAGEYQNVALSGEALMADNVMIDARDLYSRSDSVTASQAAGLLDLRTDTVAKLLANGVIPFQEVRGLHQRFPRKMINREDIAAFTAKYVSIAQLVKETGLDRNLINAKMRSRNIRPAFSPSVFRTALILKVDVVPLLEGIA